MIIYCGIAKKSEWIDAGGLSMASMTVSEFANEVQGKIWGKNADLSITNIVTDSRKAREGSLFIALKGEHYDGHHFITKALEQGAVAALSQERPESESLSVIQVDDCVEAMARLGRACLRRFPVPVVAITGSVGKTSCKEMIASVLSEKFTVLKTEGNLNTETGLPITLYRLTADHQVVVLEMGMQGLGEIAHLTRIAPPDFAAVTNILGVHLERLGSLEAIAQAKAEIFQGLKANGTAFFREEESWKDYLISFCRGEYITYGLSNQSDVYADNLQSLGLHGSTFTLHLPHGNKIVAQIGLPGKHMVENACLAAAIGYQMGLDEKEIVKGLGRVTAQKQRNQWLRLKGDRLILNDCYNSSPISMQAALDLIKENKETRTQVAVLGDMRELGDREVEEHKIIGERLSKEEYDLLITKGSLANITGQTFSELRNLGLRHWHTNENKEIINLLLEKVPEHSIVLIKGSRSLGLEEIAEQLIAFWGEQYE